MQVYLIHSKLVEDALAILYFAHDPVFESLESKLCESWRHVFVSGNNDASVLLEQALRPTN